MKKRIILTPVDLAESTTKANGVFEKQILPLGSINYKGRKITFDRKFLTDLAESFNAGAYDQVPLVYATEDNQHNLDPKRFGGEVKRFRVRPDGLYATIAPDRETSKVLAKNPRLGVSARIVEGLEKSDGRKFDRAIQHVLLTMDPRVTGMKPWRTVDLSGYNGGAHQVVDLTALTIEEESEMPRKTAAVSSVKAKAKTQEPAPDANGILDLSSLTDKQLDLLLSATEDTPAPKAKAKKVKPAAEAEVDPDDIEDEDEDDDESDEDESDDEVDEDDEVDDDEEGDADEDDDDADATEDLSAPKPNALTEALAAEKAAREAKGKKKAKPKVPVNLSSKQRRGAIDLAADALGAGDRDAVALMREEMATERWESQRKAYTKAGVPPFLLDLAAPLLSSPDAAVIDLSTSDEPVNASKVVADVLDGVKGLIDLRPEMGHRIDLSSDDEDAATETDALIKAWDNDQY